MNARVQAVGVVLVLAASAVIAKVLIDSRAEAETLAPQIAVPLVEVARVSPRSFELTVETQGEVRPTAETALSSEVPGRVAFLSPACDSGGFFEAGDTLVRLERTELELAHVRAEANLRQAETLLERERAEVAVAERAYRDLGTGEATALALRAPQLAEAEARVEAAQADVDRALLDLKRTTILAPFAGRIRSTSVGLGQVVGRGERLAELYSTGAAEVRLLLTDRELARLDLPLLFASEGDDGPETELRARFAGRDETWSARVVRTEGELDPGTRMVAVIARIDDPYARLPENAGRAPLYSGLFVSARVRGRMADEVFVLPRSVLRGIDRVHVIESEGRLAFRTVEVLWSDADQVVVSGGLSEGDGVVLSPLAAPVEGMRLEVVQ